MDSVARTRRRRRARNQFDSARISSYAPESLTFRDPNFIPRESGKIGTPVSYNDLGGA